MRNKFIGDSLDMSKRIIVTLLSQENLCLLACPLPAERDFKFELYKSVLQLNQKAYVFNPGGLLFIGQHRATYLKELKNSVSSGDFSSVHVILLDPDKGIHKSKRNNLYINSSEVIELTTENRDKTIAVYHHKNAGGMDYQAVLNEFSSFNCFAYNFGAASICFIQDGAQPINRIKDILRLRLNSEKVLEKSI